MREAWVLQHPTVEDEFEHGRVGSVPTVGVVVGFFVPDRGLLGRDTGRPTLGIPNS